MKHDSHSPSYFFIFFFILNCFDAKVAFFFFTRMLIRPKSWKQTRKIHRFPCIFVDIKVFDSVLLSGYWMFCKCICMFKCSICDSIDENSEFVHKCFNRNYVLIKWDALCGREWVVRCVPMSIVKILSMREWTANWGVIFNCCCVFVMNQTIENDKIKIN